MVIPTLDEAPRLPRLLQDLAALTLEHEIIVADGGSTDGTADFAAARGCRVVRTRPGRGAQLRAGVAASQGRWLLVLHADIRLSPGAIEEAERAIAGGQVRCAAWPLRIQGEGWWVRWIELGAAARWRLLGLAYGDQGLLVRRDLYDAAGGFPDAAIMEDVVLARRLGRLAPMTRFTQPILADDRRWQREGAGRGSLRNVTLLTLFLCGIGPERLARWYLPEPKPQ